MAVATGFGVNIVSREPLEFPELAARRGSGAATLELRFGAILPPLDRGPQDRPVLVERPTDDVYRLKVEGLGQFEIDTAAWTILADQSHDGEARWQDIVVAQVLPFAAVLTGLEAFHASGVAIGGRAVMITAPSGTGKTTLAAHLVGSGAELLSDDVVAVGIAADGRPIAHPGSRFAQLARRDADELLGRGIVEVGTRDDKVTCQADSPDAPVPLRTIVLLSRTTEPGPVQIERERSIAPPQLLAATFNSAVRTPERLLRQLDICQAVSAHCEVLRVSVGGGVGAAELSERLTDHLSRSA